MEVDRRLEKCVQECIQDLVNKYPTLSVGISIKNDLYECAVYNTGVKLIVKTDELLLMSIVKAFEPILKYIKNGKIAPNTELTENQIQQIERTLKRLTIEKSSWCMIAPEEMMIGA